MCKLFRPWALTSSLVPSFTAIEHRVCKQLPRGLIQLTDLFLLALVVFLFSLKKFFLLE